MELPEAYLNDPEMQRLEQEFHHYVAQGKDRNPVWLVNKTGLSLKAVCSGLVRGQWMQRISALSQEAAIVSREQIVGDVAGLNTRDVAALTLFVDATDSALLKAIREDRVPPAVLWQINNGARKQIRETLGLGAGQEGDVVNRMAKFLEGSTTDSKKPEEAKPFVLDPKKLAPPADLPQMPGMTSDATHEGKDRKLTAHEKELLGRG
jgi:hypothetical protein